MTDKKNLLDKLKEVFNINKEENTELNFVDVKTEDGRILRADDLAIEKPILEITEEGEMPLEDGEYKIIDGPVIKVEGGVITEMEMIEEEPEMEDEVVAEEMSEEVAEEIIEEVIEDVTSEVTAEEATEEIIEEDLELEAVLSELKGLIETVNELKELKSEFISIKEENEKLKLEVEKFAKAPSAEPTIVKETFKKEVKNNSVMYNILTSKK